MRFQAPIEPVRPRTKGPSSLLLILLLLEVVLGLGLAACAVVAIPQALQCSWASRRPHPSGLA